jgi:photosystem II stability/assembly factor-like uncharacterized protein
MIAFLAAAAFLLAQVRQPVGPMAGWTSHGPYGGFVRLTIDPGTPSTLFAEGPTEEFRSTDSASSWKGVVIPGGNLIISPSNPLVRYTNSSRSVDGGFTWMSLTYPASDDWPGHVYHVAHTLAVDPMSHDILYMAVDTLLQSDFGPHEEQIFKSIDAGLSWTLIFSAGQTEPPGDNVYLRAFLIEPANSSGLHIVIGTNQTQTILNSPDGGLTWTPASAGVEPSTSDLAAGSAGVLYIGTYGGGVFRSLDAGAHWSPANAGLSADALAYAKVAIAPSDPSLVYASTSAGVFRSADGGSTWSSTGATLVQGSLAIDPTDPSRLYYSGQHDEVLKSVDGGLSWVRADTGLTAMDVNDVAIDPFNASTVFAAVDGGVVKSADGGLNWSVQSAGLPPSAFGEQLVPDSENPGELYVTTTFSGVFRSNDAAQSWTAVNDGLLGRLLGVTIALDRRNSSVLLAGNEQGVFKTQNGGGLWHPSNSGILEGLGASSLAIDGILAFAATARGLYRSVDAGDTWSLTTLPESAGSAHVILIDSRDSSRILAATPSGVWTSANAGQSWNPTGFVDFAISLVFEPVSGALYASTTEHILRSADEGQTWTVIDRGLGGARALDASGDELYVAHDAAVYAFQTRGTRMPTRGVGAQGFLAPLR